MGERGGASGRWRRACVEMMDNFQGWGGVVAFRRRHHPETGVRGKESRSVLCCVRESLVFSAVLTCDGLLLFFFIYIILLLLLSFTALFYYYYFFFYLVTDSFFFLPFAAGWNVYLPYTPMWMDINRISGASERARPGFSLLY